MVSKTPVEDVLPRRVIGNLDEDLEGAMMHGVDTAAPGDSVLIWGPPGAGKTTESVLRLAAHVDVEELRIGDVTVVTYRTSLAESICARIEQWEVFDEEEQYDEITPSDNVATAHAIAARQADFFERFDPEEDGEHAGMVDESAGRAFCREHGIEFDTGVPWIDSQWDVFRALYTFSKQNLLDVGRWWNVDDDDLIGCVRSHERAHELLTEFHDVWGETASFDKVVRQWEAWKAREKCYDFWQQLDAALSKRLTGDKMLIIDEMHDSYPLMTMLFEEWIDAAETVIVAGDADQVCNAFSGASPAIFEGLNDRVETELSTVKLPTSHRVPDEHFEAAARVLAEHRQPPQLETAGRGGLYRHNARGTLTRESGEWSLLDTSDPASPVRLFDEYGDNIMFLARTQMLVDAIGAQLDYSGIIYQSQDGCAGNWSRRLDLIKTLSVVESVRPRRQSPIDEDKAGGWETDGDTQPPRKVKTDLEPSTVRTLIKHSDARYLDDSRKEILGELPREGSEDEGVKLTDIEDWTTHEWWGVYGRGVDSLDELVYLTPQHGFSGSRQRDIAAMEQCWIRHNGDPPRPHEQPTRLWTMHAAKGDEASHAVVYAGVTGRVRDAVQQNEADAANEARTWYVGLTRASEGLHIVRDAFGVTVDNYQQLPDDLEPVAAKRAAAKRNGGSGQ